MIKNFIFSKNVFFSRFFLSFLKFAGLKNLEFSVNFQAYSSIFTNLCHFSVSPRHQINEKMKNTQKFEKIKNLNIFDFRFFYISVDRGRRLRRQGIAQHGERAWGSSGCEYTIYDHRKIIQPLWNFEGLQVIWWWSWEMTTACGCETSSTR